MLLVPLEVRVETSKAMPGRYPMVGFHVLQGVEEVNRGDVNTELVNEVLATEIPEGAEYQTISGFVLDRIGQMPREGDEVRYRSVTIRVEQVEGTQIQRLLVTEDN